MFIVRNKTSSGSFSSKPKDEELYHASFSSLPCIKGDRKHVYKGLLHGSGDRKGDSVLVKVFKEKDSTENLCNEELERYKKAQFLVKKFNKLVPSCDARIEFNIPLVVPVDKVALTNYVRRSKHKVATKEWVIMEENLGKEFQEYVEKDGTSCLIDPTCLDAFVHYSFHQSGGKLVIVGLRGVEMDSGYKLSCPVIHSNSQIYGNTDNGQEGILKAFENHRCTNVCYSMDRPQSTSKNDLKLNES